MPWISTAFRSAKPVAAVEQREAASGCEAVVKSASTVFHVNRALRFYDCCAAGRSLALLDSCYRLLQVSVSRIGPLTFPKIGCLIAPICGLSWFLTTNDLR
ncbi:hypothetical protein EMIT0P253_20098 [Pseudomonas sp. IT-P253]